METIFEGTEEELKNNVFVMNKLNEALKKESTITRKYVISVDIAKSNKSESAYCLIKIENNVVDIVDIKVMRNRRKIKRYVKWLAEIFNAKINEE